jgi:hypothetical protein
MQYGLNNWNPQIQTVNCVKCFNQHGGHYTIASYNICLEIQEAREKKDADALKCMNEISVVRDSLVRRYLEKCPLTKNGDEFFDSFRQTHNELFKNQVSDAISGCLLVSFAQLFLFYSLFDCAGSVRSLFASLLSLHCCIHVLLERLLFARAKCVDL